MLENYRLKLFHLFILFLSMAGSAFADLALEKQVTKVSEELRCLVCQNQTIADSQADLALDLKNEVRIKLQQGMSEHEVIDFMVQRYGDFVLYRPPLKSSTWALWFGPFLLLLLSVLFLVSKLRNQRVADYMLSETEISKATNLLSEAAPKDS